MTRFVVKEVIPPKVHNPPGWAGKEGGSLITHEVWDTEMNERFTSFGSLHAAEHHAEFYNLHYPTEENTKVILDSL